MPIQKTYNDGTITVVAGSAVVTGTGTLWTAGLVNGGELFFKGFSAPIKSVGSDTSLTLDLVAPAGMAGTGTYSIALGRADAASAIVATRQLADLTAQLGAALIQRLSEQIVALAPSLIPALLPAGLNDLLINAIQESDSARDGAVAAKTAIDTLLSGTSLAALVGPATQPVLHMIAREGDLPAGASFSRASTASRVNSRGLIETVAANALRVDYDPTTGANKGWLIEEARTNLAFPSETFTAFNQIASVSKTAKDPIGGSNASIVTENTANSEHFPDNITQAVTAGQTLCWSAFVKSGTGARNVYMRLAGPVATGEIFNPATGAFLAAKNANTVDRGFVALPDGWFRVWLVATMATTGTLIARTQLADGAGSPGYTGNGSGLILFGRQLEIGDSPTSYIATTSAAVTREADNLTVPVADWFNSLEGSLYLEGDLAPVSASQIIADIGGNGAFGSTAYLSKSSGIYSIAPEAAPINLSGSITSAANEFRVAGALKRNNSVMALNGALSAVDTASEVPTGVVALRIGFASWAVNSRMNGHIRRIAYFPRRLLNTELAVITNPAFQWERYDDTQNQLVTQLAGSISQISGSVAQLTDASTSLPQGRLTLIPGGPNMTTDLVGATRIYYTPAVGNKLVLFDGTRFLGRAFAEIFSDLSNTTKNPSAIGASKINDWFVWDDGGTLRLSHGPDWSSDSARSTGTELAFVAGIAVNNVAITNGPAARRGTYVGTTRSNGSATLDFIFGGVAAGAKAAKFDVWNAYNQISVITTIGDTVANWTYSVAALRAANGNNNFRASFVRGLSDSPVSAKYLAVCNAPAPAVAAVAIGLNSTTAFVGLTSTAYDAVLYPVAAEFQGPAPIGYNFVQALETQNGTTTVTWFGKGTLSYLQTGMIVEVTL